MKALVIFGSVAQQLVPDRNLHLSECIHTSFWARALSLVTKMTDLLPNPKFYARAHVTMLLEATSKRACRDR